MGDLFIPFCNWMNDVVPFGSTILPRFRYISFCSTFSTCSSIGLVTRTTLIMWFGAIYSFHALHEIKFYFWSLGTLGIFIWKEIPKPTNQTIFSRKLLRYIKEDFHLPIKNSSIHVRILFSIFGVAVGLNFDIPNFRIKSRVNFRWTFHLEKKKYY